MSVYPEHMVAPIREDLVSVGFKQLLTAEEVEETLKQKGVNLLVVNSVCGCAAGKARPAIKQALNLAGKRPDMLTTVFAGMETEAVAKAREHMLPYPPSSPSIAFFKDGELVHLVERHHIEGNQLETLVNHLTSVLDDVC
jgi:putative YphP/YqiW family bacilliredoxin